MGDKCPSMSKNVFFVDFPLIDGLAGYRIFPQTFQELSVSYHSLLLFRSDELTGPEPPGYKLNETEMNRNSLDQ